MYECETCGVETAKTFKAFYHLKGALQGMSLGEHKTRVDVCLDCLIGLGEFRTHHQMPTHKWRLIPA
jgi:hypothetical protein